MDDVHAGPQLLLHHRLGRAGNHDIGNVYQDLAKNLSSFRIPMNDPHPVRRTLIKIHTPNTAFIRDSVHRPGVSSEHSIKNQWLVRDSHPDVLWHVACYSSVQNKSPACNSVDTATAHI
jgi:hypothetical protein